MKGVDYTKALHKDRELFQDTIRRTQDAAERRVADTNERAEHVMKKQREGFIEDKAELETNYQKNIEKMDELTDKALASRKGKLEKEMQKEREEFTRDSLVKRKDFDQRLNDIKSSYKKSFEAERDIHADLVHNQKKKYSRNINDISEKTTQKLSQYNEEMSKSGADLKDQYKRERQQLVRSHEDNLREHQKTAATQKAEMKENITKDFHKSKEIKEAEFEQLKNYSEDRLSSLQNKYEDRYQGMARDYSQRNENLVGTQQREALKTNQENENRLAEIRRDHNKQFRMIELEKRRRDNGSGEFAEVMNRQQGLRDELVQDNRIYQLKNQLADTQKTYMDKAAKDQEAFNDTLRSESTEATARLDRKLNEANANKIVSVSNEREKADTKIAARDYQNQNDKQAYEQQLKLERYNAKERLQKLKENFNTSMKQLEEKNKLALEDVTKVSNQDKTEFMKKMRENRDKEIFSLKREFNKMMDATVQEYEQRLGNYQRENEYLKLTMDQKVQNIIDQTEKQLESQRTLFEDRRSADLKNQAILLDQKEHHLKTAMNQMNNNFQKKIDKMQVENETKLKLLTNDYESKLKELKATTGKELAQKDTTHQIEQERIKIAYEDEKARLISAYENQIQAIKAGHRDQMDQMKEYKRLS